MQSMSSSKISPCTQEQPLIWYDGYCQENPAAQYFNLLDHSQDVLTILITEKVHKEDNPFQKMKKSYWFQMFEWMDTCNINPYKQKPEVHVTKSQCTPVWQHWFFWSCSTAYRRITPWIHNRNDLSYISIKSKNGIPCNSQCTWTYTYSNSLPKDQVGSIHYRYGMDLRDQAICLNGTVAEWESNSHTLTTLFLWTVASLRSESLLPSPPSPPKSAACLLEICVKENFAIGGGMSPVSVGMAHSTMEWKKTTCGIEIKCLSYEVQDKSQ